mmetsp:Transcript_29533/g.57100  ORF Transcript_29533/g.57100 Transcript_29533/m.57100 type:complete len:323 (+) Transcript_29533:211-1179(+)
MTTRVPALNEGWWPPRTVLRPAAVIGLWLKLQLAPREQKPLAKSQHNSGSFQSKFGFLIIGGGISLASLAGPGACFFGSLSPALSSAFLFSPPSALSSVFSSFCSSFSGSSSFMSFSWTPVPRRTMALPLVNALVSKNFDELKASSNSFCVTLPIMKTGGKPRTSSASSQPSSAVASCSWKNGSASRFLVDKQYSALARTSIAFHPLRSHSLEPSPPASQLYSRSKRAILLPASWIAQSSLPGVRPLCVPTCGAAKYNIATLFLFPSGRLSTSKMSRTAVPQPGRPEQQAPTSGEYRAKDARTPGRGLFTHTNSLGRLSALV